jgi:hypothetical protein
MCMRYLDDQLNWKLPSQIWKLKEGIQSARSLSRFEALLPHGQPRLTFDEMQLPILH